MQPPSPIRLMLKYHAPEDDAAEFGSAEGGNRRTADARGSYLPSSGGLASAVRQEL